MKIVFFDGVCNLCNAFVDWLIRRDKKHALHFASLQGLAAAEKVQSFSRELNTVIYFRNESIHQKSEAIIYIFFDLGGFGRIAFVFLLIPRFIRDSIYDLVAKYRYSLFGLRQTCRLPTPEEKNFFLD